MTKAQEEIIKKNTVDIRGKDYLTVAGRVNLLHEEGYTSLIIDSEVLAENPVTVKVTVTIMKGEGKTIRTSGISAANPNKSIEKMSPYEVAETSALGRALGFAGYGLVDTIATADEMVKATQPVEVVKEPLPWEQNPTQEERDMSEAIENAEEPTDGPKCSTCGAPAVFKNGVSKKTGKPYSVYFCSTDEKSHARFV